MIIQLKPDADVESAEHDLAGLGLWVRRLDGGGAAQFLVDPASARVAGERVLEVEGVARVVGAASAHPRVDAHPSRVDVAGVAIGAGAAPVWMAGPCSVESEDQIHGLARRLAPLGVTFLRGGAFKTRTSPYSFQGHGERALSWMRAAADATGLRVVTEVLSPQDAEIVAAHADLIQIGSRNMQNSPLLRAAASQGKAILLKRGLAALVEEWLLAAEYCLVLGAPAVIFCERGIRSFDPSTRNVLDLGTVALLSQVYGLPVIVDPSHGAGRRDLLAPLSRAALAAGAAGLLLETHDDPGSAYSDGPQALPPDELNALLGSLRPAPR